MKWRPYPAYKDSGVEWLGEIPAEWHVYRLKRLASFKSGNSITSLEISNSGNFPVYGGNGLRGFTSSYTHEGCFPLIGRQGALCGCINYSEGKFWASEHAVVATPIGNIVTKWLGELLRIMNLNQYSQSAAQPGIAVETILALLVPVPNIKEQKYISSFIDRETSRIDALIVKKQRQIELLQEKRAALIAHAVTKGLNPNAKMKDSGIEWLGEIPEHWELKPVKYLTGILRGKFSHRPRNDPRMYDGNYPFIQTGDIASADKFVQEYHQTLNDDGFAVSKMFPKGTLVMTIAANIGDIAIIDFEACFPDSIVGFVPKSEIKLDFLYYLFIGMRQALFSTATLNTQLNLNIDRIGSLITICPPSNEQTEIIDFLEYQIACLSRSTEQINLSISKLNEYRTALISAAVTGKIDVRGEAMQ
jgi:type I restriction enzyme S subunit